MNKLIFAITLLILITSSCDSINKRHISTLDLKTLWANDTCGSKGFRDFYINYIVENNIKSLFLNENIKTIEYYFGKPDRTGEDENNIFYWYSTSSVEIIDKKCGYAESSSLRIVFDLKSKKVVEFIRIIH